MSDFEKKVGIIEVDVDYTQAQKAVADFTDSIIDQKNTIASNNAEIKSLNKANSELEKQVKKGNLSFDEANKEIEENAKRVKNLKKENAFLGDEIKDLNKERANAVKATKLQSNSLDALKNKVKDQKKELSGLNRETEEGKKRFDELKEEIEANVDQINELEKGTGGLRDAIGSLGVPIDNAADGLDGMKKSALAFIATPLGAVLGVIAAAVALVANAMNRSEKSTNKVRKVFAVVTGVVNKLLGKLEPLGELLIDGIVKGFEAAAKAADFFLGLVGKGLDALGFEKAASSVNNLKEELNEAGESAAKLADAEAELQRRQRESTKIQLEFQKQAEKLRQIRDDESRSIEERKRANEELGQVLQKQLQEELAIRQLALQAAKMRIELEGETTENLEARDEALTEIADVEERITGQQSEQLVNINSLRNEEKALIEERKKSAEERSKAEAERIKAEAEKQKAANDLKIAREQELNAKLQELEDFRRDQANNSRVAEIEDIQEQLQAKRDIAVEDFERELSRLEEQKIITDENEALEQEEKLIKQAEFDLQIEELRAAHKETMEGLSQEQKENELAIEKEKEKERQKIASTGQKVVQGIVNFANNKISNFYNKRFADLKKQLENGQITEEEYARKKENLEQNQAIAQWKAEKIKFQIEKGVALTKATVALGEAIFKSSAFSPLTAGQPWAAINASLIGLQIAQIKSQSPPPRPSFELGGDVQSFIIGGKPHSQGGTKFWGEDGTTFEAQKDEGLFITKREATNPALQLLDQANTHFNGRSMFASSARFMQEGGSVENAPAGISPEALAEAMANMPTPVVEIESVMAGIEATQDAKNIGLA